MQLNFSDYILFNNFKKSPLNMTIRTIEQHSFTLYDVSYPSKLQLELPLFQYPQ